MKPSNKLILETKALIRLQNFLRYEVGLRTDLSVTDLKEVLGILANKNVNVSQFRKS